MIALLHSDIISLKSGLFHLTSQPCCKKGRFSESQDGITNLILWNNIIDRCRSCGIL